MRKVNRNQSKSQSMKQGVRHWLVGGIVAIPALLFAMYVLMSFGYYDSTYVVMSMAFVVVAFSAGVLASQRTVAKTSAGYVAVVSRFAGGAGGGFLFGAYGYGDRYGFDGGW
jgi:hypothetical protein